MIYTHIANNQYCITRCCYQSTASYVYRPSVLVTAYDSKGVRLNTYGNSNTSSTTVAAAAAAATSTHIPTTDNVSSKLIPVNVLLKSIAEIDSSLTAKYQEESECMLLLQAQLLLLSSKQTLASDYSNKTKQKPHGFNSTQHQTVATVTGTWQVL